MGFDHAMFNKLIPDDIRPDIYSIDYGRLRAEKIEGLIFDIDNTLVAYRTERADGRLIDFLKNLQSVGFRICFISNNSAKRVDLFNEDFNFFTCAKANKPSSKALCRALSSLGLSADKAVLIGDQLFTDVLAAKRANMKSILVNPVEPVESMFFRIKRLGEKPFKRVYYRRKRKEGTKP